MESVKNIENLLEKYFEATATVADEQRLRAYFAHEDVAAHLAQYKPMFQYFSNAKEETFTKFEKLSEPVKPRIRFIYRWASVAAAVVLAFGVYFGNEYRIEKEVERAQAEFAYQETKKALNLLAENFGRGTEKVAYLNEFEVAKQKVFNNN